MNDQEQENATNYTERLAEVNNSNIVKTTENIYNDEGLLLVAKGTQITAKISEIVTKHKLRKPVENSVSIEDQIDANALYMYISDFVNNRPDLLKIHSFNNLDKPLLAACNYYQNFQVLVQKITVIAEQEKKLFQQSVMGAWVSLGIAKQLDLQEIDIKEAFLAALIRDIGFLHLPRSIMQKENAYSVAEQKAVNSHPLVAGIIIAEIKDIPKSIKRAVVEHHERCDGAGYPKGRIADQLSLLGQVIAMADEAQHLCIDDNENTNQSMFDLTPFLSLNMSTHFEEIYKAAMVLVRDSEVKQVRNIPDDKMSNFISNLVKKTHAYNSLNDYLKTILENIDPATESLETKLIVNFGNRIQRMLVQSGILSEEYTRWIEHVNDSSIESAFNEMETTALMYKELHRQFNYVIDNLGLMISKKGKVQPEGKIILQYQEKMRTIIDELESLAAR